MFTLDDLAIGRTGRILIRPALAMSMIALFGGCDQSGGHNPAASPIVRPDSEAGSKAIAQSAELLKLRQNQEAQARNRPRTSPEPE
jgi:hypothetical protein